MKKLIDLRSDTITLPSQAMREYMMKAEVGDDVYGEDPTVASLQERMADLLKKEAALFVPTGTMANQLALGALAQSGDELLSDPTYHLNLWEGGGPAKLWGVTARTIETEGGILTLEHLLNEIRPDDFHFPAPDWSGWKIR